jgi:hypothetical protein
VLNFSGLNQMRNAIISLISTKYLKSYWYYAYNINSFVQIFALFYLNIRSIWLKNRKILPFLLLKLWLEAKKAKKWWAQKNSDCMKKFNKYWIYHLIYGNIFSKYKVSIQTMSIFFIYENFLCIKCYNSNIHYYKYCILRCLIES